MIKKVFEPLTHICGPFDLLNSQLYIEHGHHLHLKVHLVILSSNVEPPNYEAHSNTKRSRVVIFLLAKSGDIHDQHVTMINLIPTLSSIGRSFP